MNIAKAYDILMRHNEWRRGADIEMQDPKELGIAIDIACDCLHKLHNDGFKEGIVAGLRSLADSREKPRKK